MAIRNPDPLPANPTQGLGDEAVAAIQSYTTRLKAQLQSDPILQRYLTERATNPGGPLSKQLEAQLQPQSLRILQDLNAQGFNPNPDGTVYSKDPGFWEKYGPFLLAAGVVAGPIIGVALTGGAGGSGAAATGTELAADGTLTSTSTVPTLGSLAPAVAPSGAVVGGTAVGGTVGGTATGSTIATGGGAGGGGGTTLGISNSLWPTIVGTGANVLGSYFQSKAISDASDASAAAATHAADLQAQASKDALDFQKQVYGDRKTGLAPYQALGTQAAGKLGSLYGLSMPPTTAPATSSALGLTGQGQLAQGATSATSGVPTSLATLGGSSGNQPLVTVKAPTGETRQVSQADADFYVSRGAMIVQ